MKEYAEEPKVGPTETKRAADFSFDHDMLHGSEKLSPGDRVKLIIHGHVHENRGKDEFGPGRVAVKVHGVEEHPEQDSQEKKTKKPNASEMRMEDLKSKIQNMTENDENMQGHSERAIKEEGKDE